MVKQFCDLCGKEVRRVNKEMIRTGFGEEIEFEICFSCHMKFALERTRADISILQQIKNNDDKGEKEWQ